MLQVDPVMRAQLVRRYHLQAAKLRPPRLPDGHVHRPRLLTDAGAITPLTVIAAPAGYGKTTLALNWGQHLPAPCVWLTLDEEDNDSVRFWRHMLGAIELGLPGGGEGGLLQLTQSGTPLKHALNFTLNEVAADEQPLGLVIDDLHVLVARELLEQLGFFLDRLPPSIRVVLAGRERPDFPLGRWQMQGRLQVIEATDLRFTPDEAAALLKTAVDEEEVMAITARADGWAAGLQLLKLAHLRAGPAAALGSDLVFDYFAREVLDQWPLERQAFWLDTAILDQVHPGLAAAVHPDAADETARRYLENGVRQGLFVTRLEDADGWFRFHPLWREFLRNRRGGSERPLHRRAAEWYAHQGQIDTAIQHARLAADDVLLLRIALSAFDDLWRHEELPVFLNWVGDRGDSAPYPDVCLHTAWAAFLTGQIERAQGAIARAEALLQTGAQPLVDWPPDELRAARDVINSALAGSLQHDLALSLELGRRALAALPTTRGLWRSAAQIGIALASLYLGEAATAVREFTLAVTVSRTAGNVYGMLFALSQLATQYLSLGQLDRAAESCRLAISQGIGPTGRPLPIAAWAYATLSRISYLRNDLTLAEQLAREGLSLNAAGATDSVLPYLALADVAQARRQEAEALTRLQQAAALPQASAMPQFRQQMAEAQLRLAVRQGRVDALRILDPTLDVRSEGSEAPPFSTQLARAWALLALRRTDEVDALSWQLMSQTNPNSLQPELHLVRALALQALGRLDTSLAAFGQALDQAAAQRNVRVFIDGGTVVLSLLRQYLSRGGAPAFAQQVLAVFTAPPEPVATLLSDREREVLLLIADGLTNKQIAERLIIGVGTIKWHVNNILSKLESPNRTTALARARELGLLG